jgi:hypothetical protein
VIVEGVRGCLDVLRSSPAASVAQGYSFTFLPRPEGDIELNNIVYFRPTIGDSSPLRRLDKLFCSSNTKLRATASFARRHCGEYWIPCGPS